MSKSLDDSGNSQGLGAVRDDSYSYDDAGDSIFEDPSFMSASTLTQDATLNRERNFNLVEEQPVPRGIGGKRPDSQRKITFQEPEEVVRARRRRKLIPACLLAAPPWVHGVLVASVTGLVFTLAFFIAATFFMNDIRTDSPTLFPSSTPSIVPSFIPTSVPSTFPSGVPTGKPSVFPTIKPSFMPSQKPSQAPSYHPTLFSSKTPTLLPSEKPSSQPSSGPSAGLSELPSSPPTIIKVSSLETNSPTGSTVLTPSPSKNQTELPTSSNSTISRNENDLF